MIEATLALGAALIEASPGNIGIYRGIPIAYGESYTVVYGSGHLILRKSPKRTATGSSTASNISRIPIRHAGYSHQGRSLDPQKKPQENSYRIFYSLKYIPYTHSTCRIYSLLVRHRTVESCLAQATVDSGYTWQDQTMI